MWESLVGVWSYIQRIQRLRTGHKDAALIAMMGDPDEKPEGLNGIVIGMGGIGLCMVLFMVASYSLPDIKALHTTVLFQKSGA